jgi:imidazole glycerol-phosphate synthase subunit HisH
MIAIIDYGAGNVASVSNAVSALNQEYIITCNEINILKADKIIFPGVGEASSAVKALHKLNLFTMLRVCKKPLLGICLGMQLMADYSKEGDVTGLGLFPGSTEKFDNEITKVPHMGWNKIEMRKESKLFKGINSGEMFYFAHSYYLPLNIYSTSVTNHNVAFSSSVESGNFYGVQFHPEKSGDAGLKVLKNFIEL